ncbi:hypothetical protein C0995_001175 [Termitomyces sp. Mi166|nr:hypothetical protein C0995_001175 [Termitomyces sp. Mi166\
MEKLSSSGASVSCQLTAQEQLKITCGSLLSQWIKSFQMFTKIFLLKVFTGASFLECEHAAQNFVIAANNIFYKAQRLTTIAPLHKMAFGLLEGLLNNWHVLGINSVEWRQKADVCQCHAGHSGAIFLTGSHSQKVGGFTATANRIL